MGLIFCLKGYFKNTAQTLEYPIDEKLIGAYLVNMDMPTAPGPSPTGAPVMPGAMAGSPPHPGSSPVTAPGAGAGNEAAATSIVKAVMPALYKTLTAFPPGSKKNKAVLSALQALNPLFAEADGKNLVPAAIQSMAQAGKAGPLSNAPAPGIAASPTPGAEESAAA